MGRGWRRAAGVVLAGGVATAALGGCGPAPWEPVGPAPSASASVPVPNDLSGGSTERDVSAGAVTATISYWSTLRMDLWTAGAIKPLSL